jgi:hypothetical protein
VGREATCAYMGWILVTRVVSRIRVASTEECVSPEQGALGVADALGYALLIGRSVVATPTSDRRVPGSEEPGVVALRASLIIESAVIYSQPCSQQVQ